MSFWKGLLGRAWSKDRRKATRMPAPQLAAYYWTGAAPAPHSVQDISLNGLFLLTGERWYPGTHLMLALQAAADTQDKTVKSLTVQAKVVRWGDDGVGLEFVLPEHNGPNGARVFEEHTADRRSLEKYLKEIRNMNASAAVHYVISSEAGSKSAD